MARRGGCGKMQAQVPQQLNPSSDVLSSQTETAIPLNLLSEAPSSQTETEMLVNSEHVNSIGITAEVKVPVKRSYVKRNVTCLVVRRSGRLINSPIQVDYMEPVVEEINLAAVEKVNVAEGDKVDESPPNEENTSEKIQDEQPAVEPIETTDVANLNYRSLYIHSQKKVKSLKKKNRQLSQKLENALGKIEVYTEMAPFLSSMSKSNEILCKRPWITKGLKRPWIIMSNEILCKRPWITVS